MGFVLRLLFRPIGLMLLGFAATALGLVMTFADPKAIPAKTELKDAAGLLDQATKVTKKKRATSSVHYELEIVDQSGTTVKLTLPEAEIGEQTVRSLFGKPVQALYADDRDVWQLMAGSTSIIDYEATKIKRIKSQADVRESGPYVAGVGFMVVLSGFFWWSRKRRVAISRRS
jgi:hypothetical protein